MRETLSLVTKRSLGVVLLVVGAGLGVTHCGQAILTAPNGSTLRMEANPPFIEANGGVSVISVAVIEPIGTPVPDGTVVQFFTTLGRIDEQGKTNDGIARVNLVSSGRSGVASVTAVSGGEAAPVNTSTTTGSSSTLGTTTTTQRPGPGGGGGVTTQLGFAQGVGTATMTVAIGTGRPLRVTVVADAPRVSSSRPVGITVIVFDENGNPVANVPVFLRLEIPTATERLDSAGNPLFTDLNGIVTDTLRTTAAASTTARNVNVVATTANGINGNVVVAVN